MKMIEVLDSGILTTIQDGGRYGYQSYGVPVSGAMDLYSMQLANILVGNERYEAVLECTLKGPSLQFYGDVCFAVTGADMLPSLNSVRIEMNKLIRSRAGAILKLNYAEKGCRSYIAFSGGFDITDTMGSKSTYLRGGFGGLNGMKLQAGDKVPVKNASTVPLFNRKLPEQFIEQHNGACSLRVIMGPEDEYFSDNGINSFLSNEYKVTNEADRMGYRLEGPEIEHKEKPDIVSNGINLGAIQIPGSKKPIIMMADRQTTGGYTKIANIISADISKAAQLKPGDSIRFEKVDIAFAQQLKRKSEEDIRKLINDYYEVESKLAVDKLRAFNISVNNSLYNVELYEID